MATSRQAVLFPTLGFVAATAFMAWGALTFDDMWARALMAVGVLLGIFLTGVGIFALTKLRAGIDPNADPPNQG